MPRAHGKPDKPTGNPVGVALGEKFWDDFLEALVKFSGNVSRTCEVMKVKRAVLYSKREHNPEFEARFLVAKERGLDTMEDEATRRAVDGVEKGIYYQGARVDTETVYSDTLIQFLLKGGRPEKFKDRSVVEHEGLVTRPLEQMTDCELEALIARKAGTK
jgi:hypothetical protein